MTSPLLRHEDNTSILTIKIHLNSSYLPTPAFMMLDDGCQLDYANVLNTRYPGIDWEIDKVVEKYRKPSRILKLNLIPYARVAFTCAYKTSYLPEYMITRPLCQGIRNTIEKTNKSKGYYDFVIGICHTSTHVFGHFICDTLQFLALIPRDILNKSYIAITEKADFMDEYLEVIGVDPNKVVTLNSQEYLFAHFYLTFNPMPCNTQNFFTIQRLRKILVRTFNLNYKKPFRYVILRREQRRLRNPNLNEFIQKEFKQVEWEIYKPKETLNATARYFNEVALLFLVHGSGMANCVFMQEGSVICEVHPKEYDPFFVSTLIGLGIHHLEIRDSTMKLFKEPYYPVPWHFIKTEIFTGLKILGVV